MCDIGVRFSSVRLTSILAFMSIQWLIRWSHYIHESQIDMQHDQTVGHQNGKGWVIYYQVVCVWGGGGGYIFIWITKILRPPSPASQSLTRYFFRPLPPPPPRHISDKKTYDPSPTPLTTGNLHSHNHFTCFMSKSPQSNLFETQRTFIYFLQVYYSCS